MPLLMVMLMCIVKFDASPKRWPNVMLIYNLSARWSTWTIRAVMALLSNFFNLTQRYALLRCFIKREKTYTVVYNPWGLSAYATNVLAGQSQFQVCSIVCCMRLKMCMDVSCWSEKLVNHACKRHDQSTVRWHDVWYGSSKGHSLCNFVYR